jgi:hypothetical protein
MAYLEPRFIFDLSEKSKLPITGQVTTKDTSSWDIFPAFDIVSELAMATDTLTWQPLLPASGCCFTSITNKLLIAEL